MLESIVKCVQSYGKALHTRKPRSRQRPMSNLVCLNKNTQILSELLLEGVDRASSERPETKKACILPANWCLDSSSWKECIAFGRWIAKIKFTQPVKNSLKTAISIHDSAIFCPQATSDSFWHLLDTSGLPGATSVCITLAGLAGLAGCMYTWLGWLAGCMYISRPGSWKT